MSESTLTQAMRIGSRDPLAFRDQVDLGQLGMGLKTRRFHSAASTLVQDRCTFRRCSGER